MSSRYHVKIGGQGFLVRPDSYSRAAAILMDGQAGDPGAALGAGRPAPSPGWRRWQQSDWRGGDGQRAWDGKTGKLGDGRRWWTGYGVDVGEAGRVRLGPVLSTSYVSTEDGFSAMLAFGDKLYALPTSSGKIYSFDGSAWAMDHDTGKSSMASLARYRDRLYAGSGSDGSVFVGDGSTWSLAFQVAGAGSVSSMAAYGVWDATARATIPQLFLGCRFPGGEARIYRWDGSALAEVHGCQEARIEAMVAYRGRLFVATSDPPEAGNGAQGRILAFDGRSASGEWSEAIWLSDNYVAGWAIFDNLLFCGSGTGGRVWAFDGDRMVDAYRLSAPGLEYVEPLRALGVCAGRLYVGHSHPTQGAALLSKLPAAALEDAETRGRGDAEMEACRLGWHTPSTAGGGSPRTLATYGGRLYLGDQATGAATIYRREPEVYRGSGLLETSLLDGGLPGVPKLLRSLTLGHDKLPAGQYLEVRFALDGSDLFQRVEDFDDPAGCDVALTTADWRAGESVARLKGMPAATFAGKTAGDPAVPHLARKLSSPDPYSPPATFAGEFDDGEYAAVSAAGGGAAIAAGAHEGDYAHQLFEFCLAGLNPAGLRPRVVCYGKGDNGGALARGVVLRIWNHATGRWDLVGSNEAAPEEDVAARTIEATVGSFGPYVGPSGRVFLSLRSSYAGGSANPSEVGTDLVELGALWAGSGEVVSEALRLPVSGPVSGATLTLLSSQTPAGTGIELYMSADDGGHWEAVASGVEHTFAHPGDGLRWKARLTSADGLNTPALDRLKVDCFTGNWLLLGRSDTEGSTSATFPFEQGVAARRVAFRIELGSSDPSGSPALNDIELQYAFRPETKRQWEMELICEGVPGAPLVLLDGSQEGKTGRELSQILWQARARGITSFEDLDGSAHQAWFEGLEERLSDAAQDRGPQTVVRCRLTEC